MMKISRGWTFDLSEQSNGHYVLAGKRVTGNIVSVEGEEPIELVVKIMNDVKQIDSQLEQPELIERSHVLYLSESKFFKNFPYELQAVLIDEIIRGNSISEEWDNWGNIILLSHRFRKSYVNVTEPLKYLKIDDPHYWYEEIHFMNTDYALAARK